MKNLGEFIMSIRNEKKLPYALVIKGPKGSGKSTLANIIAGEKCHFPVLDGSFTDVELTQLATEHSVIIIDELKHPSHLIKRLMAADKTLVNRIGSNQKVEPLKANFIIISTPGGDTLSFDASDRRFCILDLEVS